MLPGSCALSVVLIAALISSVNSAYGQNYPSKPIRIVASEVGGGTDFAARLIAPRISADLGQAVIVENRPSGNIQGETVARAAPDGYTLLLTGSSFWIGSLLRKTPYDVIRDFTPVSLTSRAPSILVVHPSLPVKSVKELIQLAKARPGELNYGTTGLGSSNHLAAELLKSMARIDIVRINYKGGAPALVDLMAGSVQLMITTASSVMPYMKSGRLRALAVTTAEPSALVPGLPSVATSGLPGYESAALTGTFAPAGTPVAVVNLLNQEIVRIVNREDIRGKFLNSGVEAIGTSAEELAATIRREMTRLGKVIKDAGIRED